MAIIRRKSVSEQIIEYILNEIEEGKLKPGQKLMSEREFSDLLGVSRVPLREAICALSALGIVEPRQGDGTFVNRFNGGMMGRTMYIYTILDEISAHELLEVRAYLESSATMLAAKRKTEEGIALVRQAQKDFEKAYTGYRNGTVSKNEVFQADNAFHYQLAACAENKLLMEFLEAVRKPVQQHFNQENDREILLSSFKEAVEFHEDVIDMVERGDSTGAYQAMLEHVLRVADVSSEEMSA